MFKYKKSSSVGRKLRKNEEARVTLLRQNKLIGERIRKWERRTGENRHEQRNKRSTDECWIHTHASIGRCNLIMIARQFENSLKRGKVWVGKWSRKDTRSLRRWLPYLQKPMTTYCLHLRTVSHRVAGMDMETGEYVYTSTGEQQTGQRRGEDIRTSETQNSPWRFANDLTECGLRISNCGTSVVTHARARTPWAWQDGEGIATRFFNQPSWAKCCQFAFDGPKMNISAVTKRFGGK